MAFCHFIRMIKNIKSCTLNIAYVLILDINYKETFSQLCTTLDKYIKDKFGKESWELPSFTGT